MKFLNKKNICVFLSLLLVFSLFLTGCKNGDDTTKNPPSSQNAQVQEETEIPNVEQSEQEEIEDDVEDEVEEKEDDKKDDSSNKKPVANKKPSSNKNESGSSGKFDPNPPVKSYGNFTPNQTLDIVSNVFTDSLVYTGYNLKKHNDSGLRWTYILARNKRAKGWLSKIGYGGGSSGYETSNGKPNIKYFEKNGLVCASFVTYVYFNYLPNVADIDTSSLTKPKDAWNADHWYKAALDWVDKGYSEIIPFKAKINYGKHIKFESSKDIPIGSIMVFRKTSDKRANPRGGHVAIYAGYANGYHWVIHVGNDNGPEFCAVERMNCDPVDPHWPLAVISAPKHIRFGAELDVEVKDENDNPIKDVSFTLKDSSGKKYTLSKTDENGKSVKKYLNYLKMDLTLSVPEGYTCEETTKSFKLSSKNNSLNKITFTLKKTENTPEDVTE